MLRQNVSLGLVGLGVAFVIISGNFDLSVGALFGLAGVLFARMAQHNAIAIAIVVAVLACLAAGVINGIIVTRLRVNSFIATLASGAMFGGVALEIAENGTVEVAKESFFQFSLAHVFGVPIDLVILVVAYVIGAIVLARTRFGQAVYAVGSDEESARLAGIPVKSIRTATFVISAGLTSIAGALAASKVGAGQAESGTALTLDAIAVVVIGGISITGGDGAIWRVAIGVLILATLTNVFAGLAWSTQAQEVAKGCVILIALAVNRAQHSLSFADIRQFFASLTRPPNGPPVPSPKAGDA